MQRIGDLTDELVKRTEHQMAKRRKRIADGVSERNERPGTPSKPLSQPMRPSAIPIADPYQPGFTIPVRSSDLQTENARGNERGCVVLQFPLHRVYRWPVSF